MTVTTGKPTGIGARAGRHEDTRLLTGRGRFADDVRRAGALHVRMVRAPVAHARIEAIDAREALGTPGVHAVLTGADCAELGPIPIRLPRGDEPTAALQPVLPAESVRYVGQPVAAVVAEDAYTAEDAAELVRVEYAELPAVLDARECQPVGAIEIGYGEVDAAFAGAAHVVRARLDVGRHAAVPLEPRGLTAEYEPGTGKLEIWGATKVPVFNRGVLARMLGLPEERIHLHAMDTGGGFGARGEFYPEDAIVALLATRLRAPVTWTEDRAENLVALNHSRQQEHRIAAAFDAEGVLLALTDEVCHDNGAYLRTHGFMVPELTVTMLPGPYRIPAFHARIAVALTNKTPCGTYRGPGRYEGTFAREHLFDIAADRIGVDRAELRRRNLLHAGEIPHRRPYSALNTEMVLDAGDYPALLENALAHTEDWRAERDRLRAEGRVSGYGFAYFLEKSGLGPHETADVLLHPSGRVTVHSGATSLGQGVETVLAQIAAERLSLPDTVVTVINGDTDLQPFGLGSWASRSTVVAGSAVRLAADAVAEKARGIAATLLGCAPDELCLDAGTLAVPGFPERSVTLAEVAAEAGRDALEPGLAARRRFTVDHMTYPYGMHVALVEVDTGTGAVRVLRYLVAYEVGRAINPDLVEGQLLGGVAQGIGGALYEQFRYDEAGQPQATTFMDYLLPTAEEVPDRVQTLITEDAPSPDNPLGAKGAGEGGITAAGGAIANAVRDALGVPGDLGGLPLTPGRIVELADAHR
ncbi:xanthine dehydrogenase family protein molybdopterin-binding subunit [Sciscionella sediminilitoris]|uniref:xanthine dehydrogenase family protein molybdopterin-binding subunit n=1 Tax=Sciscionella sediminilitoris TaxID=1445613 RepID=UPI0004DF5EE6|nr:xanthine dehydrogenase family protein molybdopterin-binding subunit [Sciscionella sp. SE31]